MSKSGGRGGGGGGAVRVTIPETVRKTIQRIREITGKQHSDEDIYSVLKDCSMDPNDTAQKLLYLDTFHEVKRKRDKKKEVSGTQGRGVRGGRGNNSSNHAYTDALGGRNAAPRRENGANHMTEKGPSTSLTGVKKTNSNAAVVTETKVSTVTPNGLLSLPNRSSSPVSGPQSPGAVSFAEDSSTIDVKKPATVSLLSAVPTSAPNQASGPVTQVHQGKLTSTLNDNPNPTIPGSASGVYYSASDPVLAPSRTQHLGAVGAIKQVVGSQSGDAGDIHMKGNKLVSCDVGSGSPEDERAESTNVDSVNRRKLPEKLKATEKDELSENLQPSSLSTHSSSLADGSSSYNDASQGLVVPLKVGSLEDAQADDSPPCLLSEKTVHNGHVTFPNHFRFPEALKSGLTFGSFDGNSGLGTENSSGNGCDINSTHAIESSHRTDETAREPSSSNQSISSTMQVDHPDQQEASEQVIVSQSEGNGAATADSKYDTATQEMMLPPEGHQNPIVQIAPNYSFGIMPSMHGHPVQFEGHETQAQDVSRLSGFVSENAMTSSSPSPSPSPSPPVQNSVAASPQPVLYRPPYPPSFFPYGPYFNPYFLPMHQFLSHNGLPQQPSTGNAYLTPAATSPGVKFPLPQFKPVTSTGNPTPIGIQALHGSYGFNPAPAVTSGSSASNEDLSESQLKESQIYTTGPVADGTAWISPPGQDVTNLHLNSLYHLNPHGQHVTFSPAQAAHGHFPGIYPPVQTIAAPSAVNLLLQLSQGVSAAVETVGQPSSAYQQAQHAQVNWNNASY